jgi:large subunit ribosomal protein L7Ae
MPKKIVAKKKPTSAAAKKGPEEKRISLFERRPRAFGIGGHLPPKRDLTRFVRWPKYVKIQRKRRILLQRLKVPPTINQFNRAVDKGTAIQLFKLLYKYRPETKASKKQRLLKAAETQVNETEKKDVDEASKKPCVVKFGIKHVTHLVEQKKAKLVIIAHDVDPIELVVWLPTLCRKMDVPYCIVKSKARVGAVVHQKTATCLAITNVKKEDKQELANLQQICMESFNKNVDIRRAWGGGKLGAKSLAVIRKREKAIAREESARMKA